MRVLRSLGIMRLARVREEMESGGGGGGVVEEEGGEGQGVWMVSTGTPLLEPDQR